LLRKLKDLSATESRKLISGLGVAELKAFLGELDEAYKRDFWAWLINEVYTQDEATQSKRPWPDKAYLRDVAWLLQNEQLLLLPKSRRMMISWILAAYCVWKARYFPHNAVFIQSETEQKSAFIVDKRCVFIEENLAEPLLRRPFRSIRTHQGSIGRITYEDTGSYIWAIPQGEDVIRTYTFSVLFMDECEFQAEGARALASALAIAEKKAQIILVSTSNGPTGPMAEICRASGFHKFQ